ncbi:unnamed protein product [Mytilus coruscus]|uniref:Uncharacterized protein n=1 Tax=Mytilus coruscus TaxID=42192 RepID=A0A6J8D0H5_MYTCO|nr:unnamed protein product [Mytilus coruscus]
MSEIQAKTTESEMHLQSIIENKNLEEITIESITNTKIQDILTVDRFGSINVKKNPSTNIDLNRRKDRQAQILVPKVIKVINDVKLKLKRKLKTTYRHTYGCCVTKKAEFLFTNYESDNEQLIAINANGKVDYTIPLNKPYGAYDVACLGDSTVSVSTGYSHTKPGISIIDLTKRKVIKFIGLPGYPYGITYNGKSLICCVEDEDLHVISCTDNAITAIFDTFSPECSYVSTHADMIFFTHTATQTVTCCSYSGASIWEFKDISVLDRP